MKRLLGTLFLGLGALSMVSVSSAVPAGRFAHAVSATSSGQTAQLWVGAVVTSDPVFRYEVGIDGTMVLDFTLDHGTFSMPGWFAFSPAGEMFVMNLGGEVSRFLDPQGTPVFNGSIDGSFSNGWSTFREDELFATSPRTGDGSVLRFLFDDTGDAVPNGEIDVLTGIIQVNRATGELFITQSNPTRIGRYVIDPFGNAVSNGSFTDVALNNPHDMVFSPWGELFVVNFTGHSISRFVFDAEGNASPNGVITETSLFQPIGVDFSPWGELFVANRNDGMISRFVFDASFDANFNGSFDHGSQIHDLMFAPPSGPSTVQVEIDIKPGSDPNCFNNNGHGVIPVAILGSATFNVFLVDTSTVRLKGLQVAVRGKADNALAHYEDVSGDGITDLVVQIEDRDGEFEVGEATATLTGLLIDGAPFSGSDTLCIVR